MNTMKNSDIYKTAILALLFREKDMETSELSEDDLCEALYKLTQDWYWSREAEKEAEAKAQEAIPRVSEADREASND